MDWLYYEMAGRPPRPSFAHWATLYHSGGLLEWLKDASPEALGFTAAEKNAFYWSKAKDVRYLDGERLPYSQLRLFLPHDEAMAWLQTDLNPYIADLAEDAADYKWGCICERNLRELILQITADQGKQGTDAAGRLTEGFCARLFC